MRNSFVVSSMPSPRPAAPASAHASLYTTATATVPHELCASNPHRRSALPRAAWGNGQSACWCVALLQMHALSTAARRAHTAASVTTVLPLRRLAAALASCGGLSRGNHWDAAVISINDLCSAWFGARPKSLASKSSVGPPLRVTMVSLERMTIAAPDARRQAVGPVCMQ